MIWISARSALEARGVTGEAERGARAVRSAWAVAAWRGEARSAQERLEQLRAAGQVLDERHPLFQGVTLAPGASASHDDRAGREA